MGLTRSGWRLILSILTLLPSLLILTRTVIDMTLLRRRGYARHAVIGTSCAVAAWACLLISVGMLYWRNERAGDTDIGGIVKRPLMMEVTLLHSLVVPTGLWLVKGSFVAMYYKMSRHLSRRLRLLLHFNVVYLVATYLMQIVSHLLWCNSYIREASPHCTPFSSVFPISFYAFLNITSDLLVMITPIILMQRVTFSPRALRGMAFLCFLGLGMVATAATCCYFHLALRGVFLRNWEFTRLAGLLAVIELAVGLMAVALPSVRAVLRRRARDRRAMEAEAGETGKQVERGSRIESETDGVPLSPWEEREQTLLVGLRLAGEVVRRSEGVERLGKTVLT